MAQLTVEDIKTLPAEELDHINGDRTDNRISNLRLANRTENMRNRKLHANNKSGFKGVTWYKGVGKWYAGIRVCGKQKHLGYFAEKSAAAAAYCNAAEEIFGEFHRQISLIGG